MLKDLFIQAAVSSLTLAGYSADHSLRLSEDVLSFITKISDETGERLSLAFSIELYLCLFVVAGYTPADLVALTTESLFQYQFSLSDDSIVRNGEVVCTADSLELAQRFDVAKLRITPSCLRGATLSIPKVQYVHLFLWKI